MQQHAHTAPSESLGFLSRRWRRLAWLLAWSASCTACALDPVATTDKCKGPGPYSQNCPQCQTPPFAAECGQCMQSGADPELCLSVIPDGGASDGSPYAGGVGGAAGTSKAGAQAAGAGNASVGTAGHDGSSGTAGGPAPACRSNADCRAPLPACLPSTQKCVGCIDDSQCSAGLLCDTLKNRCVDCLRDDDCGTCPGGASDCRPKEDGTCSSEYRCVDCEGNRGCTQDEPVCVDHACAECASDGDCSPTSSGAKRQCTAEHRCVGCETDMDCAAPTPVCDAAGSQMCLGCLSNGDCAAPTPVCDTAGTHTCLGCLSNSDCAAPTPVCDAAGSHTCLGCLSNSDCGGDKPLCDSAGSHSCVACLSNSDCGGDKPLCDSAGSHTCVGCLSNSDCHAPTPACAADGQECVECQVPEDCPKPEAANCRVRFCSACVADDDCKHLADTPFCSTGTWRGICIQCRSDADCGTGTCDLTMFRCSTTRPRSVADCMPCGNNSQCFEGSACIPRQTAKYPGTFCLPLMQGGSCPGPLSTTVRGTPTTNNEGVVDVCATPPNTSCKAVRASLDRLPCDNDGVCGESPTDGTCRNAQCTYYCSDVAECRSGLRCEVWCQP